MTPEEVLPKIIPKEIDIKFLSELFDTANVPKEESDPQIQKFIDRQQNVRIRMIWNLTNERIHKIEKDETEVSPPF